MNNCITRDMKMFSSRFSAGLLKIITTPLTKAVYVSYINSGVYLHMAVYCLCKQIQLHTLLCTDEQRRV